MNKWLNKEEEDKTLLVVIRNGMRGRGRGSGRRKSVILIFLEMRKLSGIILIELWSACPCT